MTISAAQPARSAAGSSSTSTVPVALPLVLGVVGFEQLLHTGPGGPPVYQVLHWLSDSLMALPLGLAAVWLGSRLALRAARARRAGPDALARACLIAIIFAVLLVPGGILHEQIDNLTQAHKAVSVHTHGGLVATRNWTDPDVFAAYVIHAFSDGLIGQLVGLPLLLGALAWIARRRPLRTTSTAAGAFHHGRTYVS
jgi:hypothetical protein